MNYDDRYPIGTEVQIANQAKLPSGWSGDMMHLIGKRAIIIRNEGPDGDEFYYRLDRWDWVWRHQDLIPVDLNNPNIAFRVRKHVI